VDVVYIVGPGERNEALRFSLRSLSLLAHDRVWVAGFCPSWVTGVGQIPVAQTRLKYHNSAANMRAACEHPEVSAEFVYFNDDFFVLQPLAEVPVLHRGPLNRMLQLSHPRRRRRRPMANYRGGREATAQLLAELGFTEPLAYEPLHTPMPVSKAGMRQALIAGQRLPALHYRTLYGNLTGIGGRESINHKIADMHRRPERDWLFVSTDDRAFEGGAVGKLLHQRFPDPSPYEKS
jgi:hypothetical protein